LVLDVLQLLLVRLLGDERFLDGLVRRLEACLRLRAQRLGLAELVALLEFSVERLGSFALALGLRLVVVVPGLRP